jgi:radical SAM protein with 4Fe4S-binding SPASM domain
VANLAITAVCNQHCAYCFTADYLAQLRGTDSEEGRAFLDPASFEKQLDFLARSNIDEVRLLGGEPTLHPDFVALVERARAVSKEITVFSNGLMPPEAVACLAALSTQECTVVVNLNEPHNNGNDSVYSRQLDTMRRLGERAMPGFNIYRTDFRPEFLLDLVAASGCQPVIRLGMAQPCLSGANVYLHPNQYRTVAVKIVRFARMAATTGVKLDFDCGFVRCMFSDADLEALKKASANVGWRCSPILDVDLEGNVFHCYPLAGLARLPLTAEVDSSTLKQAFESRTRAYRQAGVFPECTSCPFKAANECSGGCLAATIRRFRHTPFRATVPRRWEATT